MPLPTQDRDEEQRQHVERLVDRRGEADVEAVDALDVREVGADDPPVVEDQVRAGRSARRRARAQPGSSSSPIQISAGSERERVGRHVGGERAEARRRRSARRACGAPASRSGTGSRRPCARRGSSAKTETQFTFCAWRRTAARRARSIVRAAVAHRDPALLDAREGAVAAVLDEPPGAADGRRAVLALRAEPALAVAPQPALLLLLGRGVRLPAAAAAAACRSASACVSGLAPLRLPELEDALVEPRLRCWPAATRFTRPLLVSKVVPIGTCWRVLEVEELVAAGQLDPHGARATRDTFTVSPGIGRRELRLGRPAAELEGADVARPDRRGAALVVAAPAQIGRRRR